MAPAFESGTTRVCWDSLIHELDNFWITGVGRTGSQKEVLFGKLSGYWEPRERDPRTFIVLLTSFDNLVENCIDAKSCY